MAELAAMPKYEVYKDSGIDWLGQLPSDWVAIKMKYLYKDTSIKNRATETLLSVTQNQGVVPRGWVENRMVMPSGNLESFKFIEQGDFAISLRSFEGGLEYCHQNGIISPAYTVLKSKRPDLVEGFYKYLFKSQTFISELQTSVVGIREGKNISYEELQYSLLPIPSESEQSSIANFLNKKTAQIDEAISIKEKQIELLKERKQIIIQQAVTQGLDTNAPMKDSGVDWIGEIPEHWEVTKLGFVSNIGNGSTPSRASIPFWKDGVIPWLNSSKVNDQIINNAEQFVTKRAVKDCHLPIVEPGSLVMAITGEGKTRGMVAVSNIKTTINQHLAYISVNNAIINPSFVLVYLRGMYSQIRGDSSGLGSTKGAITCGDLKKYSIPKPPMKEQVAIVKYIENETEKTEVAIGLQIKQIEKLKEYKTTLINSAVTGKIKVPEVDSGC